MSYHCLVDTPTSSVDGHLLAPRQPCDAHTWISHPSRSAWTTRRADVERLIPQLVFALLQLHNLGILHQDVRPANLLVTTPANQPATEDTECLLNDFGKAVASSHLQYQYLVPAGFRDSVVKLGAGVYETPEHAEFDHARSGIPTDMWALGMTLVELLLSGVADAPCSKRMRQYRQTKFGQKFPHPFHSLFCYARPAAQSEILNMLTRPRAYSKKLSFGLRSMLPPELGSDGRKLIAALLHQNHYLRPESMQQVWNSPYLVRLREQHEFRAPSAPTPANSSSFTPAKFTSVVPTDKERSTALCRALWDHTSTLAETPSWPIQKSDGLINWSVAQAAWWWNPSDPTYAFLRQAEHTASTATATTTPNATPAVTAGSPCSSQKVSLPTTPAEVLLRLCTLASGSSLHLDRVFRALRVFFTGLLHLNAFVDSCETGTEEMDCTADSRALSLHNSNVVALMLASLSLADKVTGIVNFVTPAQLLETLLLVQWRYVGQPSLLQVVQAECFLLNYASSSLLVPTLISRVDLTGCPPCDLGGIVAGFIGWHLQNPFSDPAHSEVTFQDLLALREKVDNWMPQSALNWQRALEIWKQSVRLVTPCCPKFLSPSPSPPDPPPLAL
jgi:serine/threonine protein kinase